MVPFSACIHWLIVKAGLIFVGGRLGLVRSNKRAHRLRQDGSQYVDVDETLHNIPLVVTRGIMAKLRAPSVVLGEYDTLASDAQRIGIGCCSEVSSVADYTTISRDRKN